ncbi:hypothetical protein HPB47_020878, partial [Ixodes persulcatus]
VSRNQARLPERAHREPHPRRPRMGTHRGLLLRPLRADDPGLCGARAAGQPGAALHVRRDGLLQPLVGRPVGRHPTAGQGTRRRRSPGVHERRLVDERRGDDPLLGHRGRDDAGHALAQRHAGPVRQAPGRLADRPLRTRQGGGRTLRH